MARYDGYPSSLVASFVVDVQTNLLGGLNTRVVVPLMPADAEPKPAALLNPLVEIDAAAHLMVTQYLAALPSSALGKPVDNMGRRGDVITRALEMMFQRF